MGYAVGVFAIPSNLVFLVNLVIVVNQAILVNLVILVNLIIFKNLVNLAILVNLVILKNMVILKNLVFLDHFFGENVLFHQFDPTNTPKCYTWLESYGSSRLDGKNEKKYFFIL